MSEISSETDPEYGKLDQTDGVVTDMTLAMIKLKNHVNELMAMRDRYDIRIAHYRGLLRTALTKATRKAVDDAHV